MHPQTSNSNIMTPRFEGFFIQMVTPGLEDKCQEIVTTVLSENWQVKPIDKHSTEFEITLEDDALSIQQAWDKSYELQSHPEIVDVEPLFAVPIAEARDGDELQPRLTSFEDPLAEESTNVYWGLEQMRILQVWEKYFPDPNQLPGHGVVIAHPDTGYTHHPEITENLLLEKGHNFIRPEREPLDLLETSGGEVINNPGHGTSTASLMISPPDAQGNYSNDKYVVGVAPGAKLVPLRVSYSVVLLSTRALAQAIQYAADNGCHVINISLGTAFPNRRLRSAIAYAQERGVIIVAASGTMVPYVIYPAAYDEVIAVSGSNIRREIWRGASRGRRVDVTAPAQALWHAKPRKKDDVFTFNIEQDSGTSFSAPLVAGVAALWLSYHDRDKLIERYGAPNIPIIFNQMLQESCDRFPTWEPNKFGAGIVNAEKLMAAPLPDIGNQSVITPGLALQKYTPVEDGEGDIFLDLFESQNDRQGEFVLTQARLNEGLAELLQFTEAELPQILQEFGKELAFHFVVNPQLYEEFAASLRSDKPSFMAQVTTKTTQSVNNQNTIREMLLTQGVSTNLNRKLLEIKS